MIDPGTGLVQGPDGSLRCSWAVSATYPEYAGYHDDEWGRPIRDERGLFERLSLEAFQSGLSWITILRKRPAFRESFAGFDPREVAEFGTDDIERLLGDTRIVRNRAKIEATIANAKATLALGGGLPDLIWSYVPDPHGRVAPRVRGDVAARTAESMALAHALGGAGFRFVGPTTAYALMQAAGLVDDHLVGCIARGQRA